MKKNKTIAYMLAATLLVGGTFVGTKAWFTDTKTSHSDLIITTGNLGIDIIDYEEWFSANKDNEALTTNGKYFENVKPGEGFGKIVVVENQGTLATKLSVEGGNITDNGILTIESDHERQLDGEILNPGEKKHFEIGVTLNKDLGNENQGKTFELSDYMTDIIINADQINK